MDDRTQIGKMMVRRDPLMTFKWVVLSMPNTGYDLGPEYVETIEVPFNNLKVEGVFRGGGYCYFPGFHDVSAFNVTFYADMYGKSLDFIIHWKSLVKDFGTGIYALPPQYKRDWTVGLMKPTGEIAVQIRLEGTWPADTGQLSLNYNESSALTFNQNFSIDNAVVV